MCHSNFLTRNQHLITTVIGIYQNSTTRISALEPSHVSATSALLIPLLLKSQNLPVFSITNCVISVIYGTRALYVFTCLPFFPQTIQEREIIIRYMHQKIQRHPRPGLKKWGILQTSPSYYFIDRSTALYYYSPSWVSNKRRPNSPPFH